MDAIPNHNHVTTPLSINARCANARPSSPALVKAKVSPYDMSKARITFRLN